MIRQGSQHMELDAFSRKMRRLKPKIQCNAMAAQPGGDLEERAAALIDSKYCE
jgi:hypothetical protein